MVEVVHGTIADARTGVLSCRVLLVEHRHDLVATGLAHGPGDRLAVLLTPRPSPN